MLDFKFTNEYANTDEVVSFLLGPRLWIPKNNYPDFLDWADKAYREIKKETKRAMVCFYGKRLIGSLVYQRHKIYPELLELKNLTLEPSFRGRHISSFLLRQAEIEGTKDFKTRHIVCDAKKENLPIRRFLIKHKYKIIGETDIYGLKSGSDNIYFKQSYFCF